MEFVTSQYDPRGLVCPILMKLKIMLRELYETELSLVCDDPISEHLRQPWTEMLTIFLYAGEIVLDQSVKPREGVGKPELIAFADESLEVSHVRSTFYEKFTVQRRSLLDLCVLKHS